jgi:hypothetical protein
MLHYRVELVDRNEMDARRLRSSDEEDVRGEE